MTERLYTELAASSEPACDQHIWPPELHPLSACEACGLRYLEYTE